MTDTPRSVIRAAAKRLAEAGIPEPAVDASLLLEHLTGIHALRLRLDEDTRLSAETLAAYLDLIGRRARRVPLQWLTGVQSFCGYDFRVTPDVLIPRPETSLLAERAVAIGRGRGGFSMLDLCCGSGCIAVVCALRLPGADVTACDLSDAAIGVAKDNAGRLGAGVRFLRGDLFAAVDGMRFDVIASNPPYIPTADCGTLQPEVLAEPRAALDGGADGLDFYRRIAREAPDHLRGEGTLLLEVGLGQADAVMRLLDRSGFTDITAADDLAGIPRMVEGHLI